jgi:hypothetical protein
MESFKKDKVLQWMRAHKIATVFLGLILLGAIGSFLSPTSSNSSPSSSGQQTTSDRKYVSIAYAESVIEQLLKSPSTANFTDVQAYELSNQKDVWAVNGYVDSENSFGASLRSIWEVDLDYSDGKGGTVKSIMFDGKKVQ